MTKEEFEKGYAERSGVTVEWLHSKGQGAVPCNCDYELCDGWQMVDLQNYAQQRLYDANAQSANADFA